MSQTNEPNELYDQERQITAVGAELPTVEINKVPELERVKVAHVKLMRAYVAIIAAASQLRRVPGQTHNSRSFIHAILLQYSSPWITRMLVGGHIRQKLTELGAAYLQLEQTARYSDPWLPETRKACFETAEQLPKSRLPSLIALVSVAASIVAVFGKPSQEFTSTLIHTWAIVLLLLPIIFYITIFYAYRDKRTLFLPKARSIDKLPRDRQWHELDGNIYAVENELFKLLNRGKAPERSIDVWTFFLAAYLTGIIIDMYLTFGTVSWVTLAAFLVWLLLSAVGSIWMRNSMARVWR